MYAWGVAQSIFFCVFPDMNEHPSSYITAHVGSNAGMNKHATVHIPSNCIFVCISDSLIGAQLCSVTKYLKCLHIALIPFNPNDLSTV